MSKSRTRNTVAEIEGFVARGHSQSPSNCRVLLDEIAKVRAGNAQAAETILALRAEVSELRADLEVARAESASMWRGGVSNTVAIVDRVRNQFAKGMRLKKNARLAHFDAELDIALGEWFDKTRGARPTSYVESEDVFRATLNTIRKDG